MALPLQPRGRPDTRRSVLLFVFVGAFAFRLIYAGSRQLVPDEAFYWVLSRHLHAGYLDHPPMVALLIRLGTLLFGSTELGVRCMAAVTAFGALLVLLSLCRRLVGQERAGILLTAMWLCSPLLAVVATIMTPDAPSIFFSMCAMACAVRVALQMEDSPAASTVRLWLGFGFFTGLAMLSKYTAVLPAAAVVLALLTSERGRKEFTRPGIWLAALVALIVFSPVIQWNAAHDWASFKYQLHHGLDEADAVDGVKPDWLKLHLGGLAAYLGGQMALFTPVLFIFAVVILAKRWWVYRQLPLAHRVLVWSATVPLVFFGFSAFKSGSGGEINWPAFAYFPMSLLLVDDVARTWKRSDVRWLKIGCGVALSIAIVLHAPELLYKTGLLKDRFPRKLNELFGWRELAHFTAREASGSMVVAGRHQDAGELAFYMPGQPEVWCYPVRGSDGKLLSRPTAFDYFPDRPDVAMQARVAYVQGHPEAFCRNYGFAVVASDAFSIRLHGRLRDRSIVMCIKSLQSPSTPPSPRTGRTGRTTRRSAAATSTSRPATGFSR